MGGVFEHTACSTRLHSLLACVFFPAHPEGLLYGLNPGRSGGFEWIMMTKL